MSYTTRTYRIDTLTDDEGREFELPIHDEAQCVEYHSEVSDLPDGRVLVSYLAADYDRYDLNPAEEDCSGWQRFDIIDSQSDADALSDLLSECMCGYAYSDHFDDEGVARTPEDLENWIFCTGFVKPPARLALEAGRAFIFEKYEHGLVNYALRGESSQVDRQWDVSNVAGFMWADDDWGDDVDIEEMARSFLRTYTDWCNGNVWTVVHAYYTAAEHDPSHTRYVLDDDDYDSCGGYIGDEYAMSVLVEEHNERKDGS